MTTLHYQPTLPQGLSSFFYSPQETAQEQPMSEPTPPVSIPPQTVRIADILDEAADRIINRLAGELRKGNFEATGKFTPTLQRLRQVRDDEIVKLIDGE